MYNCNRYSWSGHNEIIHKSENPLVDIESLFFIIGGNQGIEVKRSNYNKIFVSLAYKYGDSNREKIAYHSGLSPSRVSNINREYEEGRYDGKVMQMIASIEKDIREN